MRLLRNRLGIKGEGVSMKGKEGKDYYRLHFDFQDDDTLSFHGLHRINPWWRFWRSRHQAGWVEYDLNLPMDHEHQPMIHWRGVKGKNYRRRADPR